MYVDYRKEETEMESYVERWAREQKAAAQKKTQKKATKKPQKGVIEDGQTSRSEGHEAQKE